MAVIELCPPHEEPVTTLKQEVKVVFDPEAERKSEMLTEAWQKFWNHGLMELSKTVTEHNLTITVPTLEGASVVDMEGAIEDANGITIPTGMIYYPSEFKGLKGMYALGKMFPTMKSYALREKFHNAPSPLHEPLNDTTGWLNVEMSGESPNLQRTTNELQNYFRDQDRTPMNINQYIILGQFMNFTSGRYADEYTYSRLLNTIGSFIPTSPKETVSACFYGSADNQYNKNRTIGRLIVFGGNNPQIDIGARSVKKVS